jgi:hypothetical protein
MTPPVLSWGDSGKKKGNKLKMTMKNRKRNGSMKKNRPDRKFPSKWQTERLWTGQFLTRKKT